MYKINGIYDSGKLSIKCKLKSKKEQLILVKLTNLFIYLFITTTRISGPY